jgi:hypothetical protein
MRLRQAASPLPRASSRSGSNMEAGGGYSAGSSRGQGPAPRSGAVSRLAVRASSSGTRPSGFRHPRGCNRHGRIHWNVVRIRNAPGSNSLIGPVHAKRSSRLRFRSALNQQHRLHSGCERCHIPRWNRTPCVTNGHVGQHYVWLSNDGGAFGTDTPRVRVRRRNDCRSFTETGCSQADGARGVEGC